MELHGSGAGLRSDEQHTHAGTSERVPRARERVSPPEAHGPRECPARGRARQTGPGHLCGDVPGALPTGPPHRLLHQLSAEELFLRLHALRPLTARGPQLLQMTHLSPDMDAKENLRQMEAGLTRVTDPSAYNDCFVLLHGLFCPYTLYHKSCALCKRLFSCTMLNHD